MGGRSTAVGSGEPGALTDPWAPARATSSPARWWRPPAAVLLGTLGLLVGAGSARQGAGMLVLAVVVAIALFVQPRGFLAGADPFLRIAAVAVACALVRPEIGGRQLALTVIGVGLASLALGAPAGRRGDAHATSLAVAPLAAAQVIALRHGSDALLVAMLAGAGVLVAVGRLRPAALDGPDRAVARGGRALASAVGAVILFPVVLVCLYLPGLLVRTAQAARRASTADDTSAWQPYDVDLADEQADSTRPFASTPRPLRVRRHLAGAAFVAVVALIAGAVIVRAHRTSAPEVAQGFTTARTGDRRTSPPPGGAPTDGRKKPFAAEFAARYSSLPAYRGVSWADELQRHEGNDPEIRSRWVNVHDSVRASLPPPRCACKRLKVWFVGGSAAFGYGQRDEHTIAADLVRLGAASGISIDMENLGRAGATLAVEAQQIRARLEREDPPDLIIFFDGFNDGLFVTAFNFGDSHGTDDRAELDGLGALEYINAHPEAYLRSTVGAAAGREALAGYRTLRAEMETLARSRGIATAWFFQPDAFVDPRQLKGYDAVTNVTPAEFVTSPLATALETMADGLADDGVTNLRPLFARHRRPVFLGVVHQTEEGAAVTAKAIYEHLGDEIERLAS